MTQTLLKHAAIALSALFLAGAAQAQDAPERSGFLSDETYALLEKDKSPAGLAVQRWHVTDLDPGRYRQVMVQPVVFYPANPVPSERVGLDLLAELPRQTTDALVRAVARALPVVNQPGEGTLLLRAAITAVAADTQRFRARELLPIALIVSAAKYAAGSRPLEASIQFEWELWDVEANRLLAAGVRKGFGDKMDAETGKMTLKHLQPAIKTWAEDAYVGFNALKAKRN